MVGANKSGEHSDPMKHNWTIAIDTREQRPLEFPDWPCQTVTLTTGDYSIIGFENQIAIERKSLDDWVNSVIQGQDRFKRELERFREIPFRCIVVEGDLQDLFAWQYRSDAVPLSVIGLTLAMMIDYQIPVLFCSTRDIATIVVVSFLKRAFKRLTKKDE